MRRLDDGSRVFSHLGMTGAWVQATVDAPARSSERARLDVVRHGSATSVRYVDARRFGRLVVARRDIADWTALGPDSLADGIDVRRLTQVFAKSRRAVKELLMDQRVLAGIGNILATEALWIARVDPRSPACGTPAFRCARDRDRSSPGYCAGACRPGRLVLRLWPGRQTLPKMRHAPLLRCARRPHERLLHPLSGPPEHENARSAIGP